MYYKIGVIVVNLRAVARFKLSRLDEFEARNRPHLHILVRCALLLKIISSIRVN